MKLASPPRERERERESLPRERKRERERALKKSARASCWSRALGCREKALRKCASSGTNAKTSELGVFGPVRIMKRTGPVPGKAQRWHSTPSIDLLYRIEAVCAERARSGCALLRRDTSLVENSQVTVRPSRDSELFPFEIRSSRRRKACLVKFPHHRRSFEQEHDPGERTPALSLSLSLSLSRRVRDTHSSLILLNCGVSSQVS